MILNADFDRRAAMHAARMDWVPSPIAGVDRKMLDRVGGEVARATSIVRYAPGSRFSAHIHDGGEEFIVLNGVFQDEHGDYPAGSYIRNPPESSHTPGSAAGCTILVKLWQFDPADRTPVRIDAYGSKANPVALFRDDRETVRIERWAPDALIAIAPAGSIEAFCLQGRFDEGGEAFHEWSWLRLPVGAALTAKAGPDGCLLWIKEGHLRHVATPPSVAADSI